MKKIFCIFAVLLILVASIIPAFALSPTSLNLVTPVTYNTITYSAREVTLNCYHNAISFSGQPDPRFYISDFSRWIPAFRLYPSHIYFIYLNTTAAYAISINTPYWSTTFNSSQRLTVPYNGMYSMGFTGGFSPDTTFIYKVNLFDLTAMYGEGNEPSAQQFLDDLSFLNVDPGIYIPDKNLSVSNSGFFAPLGQMYVDLLHSFDYFPKLWTSYSPVVTVVTVSVCLSGFVAVIILFIKRCKS